VGISDDGLTIVGQGLNPAGHHEGWLAMLSAPVIAADIDVKPGNERSPINPISLGVIPVAILGGDGFDVADIDLTTLTFGPGGARPMYVVAGHHRDVNADGFADLVVHFRTEETRIAFGDTEACLSGETLDGQFFERCDTIRTVFH